MRAHTQISPDILLKAYAFGVFPMAEGRGSSELYWMDPDMRGILPLDAFHVPRRLAKTVRGGMFTVKIDTAFRAVMESCAQATPERRTTWINEQILKLYTALFEQGHAHSVEAWQDGVLAGGLYGVSLGGAFFGESMFSRARDASKVALVHLVGRLIAGGFSLLDTQFTTSHLAQFGAIEIKRADYKKLLARAVHRQTDFFALPPECSGADVLKPIGEACNRLS